MIIVFEAQIALDSVAVKERIRLWKIDRLSQTGKNERFWGFHTASLAEFGRGNIK